MLTLRKLLSTIVIGFVVSFSPNYETTKRTLTSLQMGKKIRNKQAELAQKMKLAKQQAAEKQGLEGSDEQSSDKLKLSDEEMKEINDRRRFDDLLKQQAVTMNDLSSDGYLSKEQEEAEMDAVRKGVDLMFEGDPAPSQPFENLASIRGDDALGENGARRLVPWLKNVNKSDYLIVICDPRVKSPDLRDAVTNLARELPKPILSRMIVINADTPAENRRFLKKSSLSDSLNFYSDEKREWMKAYTALGQDRWSISMFIVADERLQKVARDVDVLSATKTVRNAVKAMESRRL